MNSTRILLSDRHFHDLRLSEMEIGVIVDALRRLSIPNFDSDVRSRLIALIVKKLNDALEQPVSHSTVPEAEEREWQKVLDELQSDKYHV
jgi:hypothetical protein